MLIGGRGGDTLLGGGGPDRIKGGPGRDVIVAGYGNDAIIARDGEPDRISCGPGRDRVAVDGSDAGGTQVQVDHPGPVGGRSHHERAVQAVRAS